MELTKEMAQKLVEESVDEVVTIPKGVTRIGDLAFSGCSSLKVIKIPEGVTSIGDFAFEDCTNLTEMKIPEGVINIGDGAFSTCTGLTEITIPEGVISIGVGSFCRCRSLTEIKISEGVTRIGNDAFNGCNSLTKITIPKGVTRIGDLTFAGCSSLIEITIPEGVTSIESRAFEDCSSLEAIKIPEEVKSIGMNAFEDCRSLTEITIPKRVTKIGDNAFRNCVGLTQENVHIEYEEDIKELLESSVLILNESIDIDEYIHKKCKKKYLLKKIVDLIGYDEAKELISCPKNISKEEYEKLGKEYQERFKEVYEKRYVVRGKSSAVIGFLEEVNSFHKFRNVEDSFLVIFNQEMETSSNLNESLDKTCRRLEEKGKKINLTEDKKNSLRKNMYEEIWKSRKEEIEKIVREKLRNEEIGHPQIVRDYLIKAISRTMKEEGEIEEAKEELRKILDNLTEAHQEIVEENKKGKIDKILEEIYKENEKLLRVNYLEIIKKYKERIEKGWIFKSLKVSKKGLDNLELEDIELLRIPNEEYEEYYKVKDEKKAGELLRDAKFSKLMTFEKTELMFNAIIPININYNDEFEDIEPEYSEDFVKFFLSHKDEILENFEYYERFSEMHNKFESLKERADFLRHLKNGNLTIDMVIRACNEKKHENVREENEELDDIMQMGDQKAFDVAQEVFEITKKRESTTIPYVEENSPKFRSRMLRPDEPAQLGVGYNTTCCQQLGGWGESSMLHSALSRNGRVFVIEEWNEEKEKYEIIGQSWVWREKDRICFDNIEIQNQIKNSMSEEEKQEILNIYIEASKKLLEKDKKIMTKLLREGKITQEQFKVLVLKDVTTGMGCSDLETKILENKLKRDIEKIQVDSQEYFERGYDKFAYGENKDELYIDARTQYILAESKEYKRDREVKGKEVDISVEYLKERQIKDLKGDQIKSNIIREIKRIRSNNLGIEKNENIDINEFYYENYIDYTKAEVAISYDLEWYILYEERKEEIYLVSSMIDKKLEANKENRLNEVMLQLELKLKMLEIIERGMLKEKKLKINRQENEEVLSIIEELRKQEIINDIQTTEDMTTIGIDREKTTEDEYKEKIEKIKKEKEKVIEELQKQYETREQETMTIKDIKEEERE